MNYLLEHGVDPNCRGQDGDTPLHVAVACDNVLAIKILIEAGAVVEATNDLGETPIDKAVFKSKDAFEYLLQLGATPGLYVAVCQDRLDLVRQILESPNNIPKQRHPGLPDLFFAVQSFVSEYQIAIDLLHRHGFDY